MKIRECCPENCRWATKRQQANNRKSNRQLTHNGHTQNLCEWADMLGINRETLRHRLLRGWSVGKALTTPVQRRPF